MRSMAQRPRKACSFSTSSLMLRREAHQTPVKLPRWGARTSGQIQATLPKVIALQSVQAKMSAVSQTMYRMLDHDAGQIIMVIKAQSDSHQVSQIFPAVAESRGTAATEQAAVNVMLCSKLNRTDQHAGIAQRSLREVEEVLQTDWTWQ